MRLQLHPDCFLDMAIFRNFIYTNGEFAYQIIIELSKTQLQNMHSCINSIQRQTIGNVAQCILSFAKDIYGSNSFTLPISRQDLGEMAGTTRESASRILSELNNENIIKLEGTDTRYGGRGSIGQSDFPWKLVFI